MLQNAKRASAAAAPLAAWVKANVQYSHVLEKIQPLETEHAGLMELVHTPANPCLHLDCYSEILSHTLSLCFVQKPAEDGEPEEQAGKRAELCGRESSGAEGEVRLTTDSLELRTQYTQSMKVFHAHKIVHF